MQNVDLYSEFRLTETSSNANEKPKSVSYTTNKVVDYYRIYIRNSHKIDRPISQGISGYAELK